MERMRPFIEVNSPAFLRVVERLAPGLVSVSAISLWPFVVSKETMGPALVAHEGTHSVQQIGFAAIEVAGIVFLALLLDLRVLWALTVVPVPYLGTFYLWYATEYGIRWLKHRNGYDAYINLAFERQAYHAQIDRKIDYNPFGWIKHLK